jgi:hypothetical protein
MKILIITADDFGYDDDRNRGIVESFTKGAITRTSLLVNGVSCVNACRLAKLYNIPLGGPMQFHFLAETITDYVFCIYVCDPGVCVCVCKFVSVWCHY